PPAEGLRDMDPESTPAHLAEDELDLLLQRAFTGRAAPVPAGSGSVLRVLRARSKSSAPIRLRDPPTTAAGRGTADAAAPPPAARPEFFGRYAVRDEVARGGLGVILRAEDVDLGREVALKVLLERHADDADMVRRLIEEAQIGGQLQHPGIVPVYEV